MARRAARAKPGGMGFERLKRPYDRVVSAVLVHVLALSVVALGLGELAELAAVFTGDAEAEWLWRRIAESAGTSDVAVRLVVFGVAQALIAVVLWRPVGFVRERLVVALDGLPAGRVGTALGVAGTALLTGVLLPFVLQPTLVPLSASGAAWTERTANLLDGTASAAVAASMVGAWHKAVGRAVYGGHEVGSLDGGITGPAMTRWDVLLREVTVDREHFAQTRAFLWVESAGRQYAVSRTGCAGLMQFCVSTAQRRPFAGIFGVGAVSACDCGGRPCAVPADVARALETEVSAMKRHRAVFPCDPADARFDPARALRAGAAYTAELAADFGGNLELMYVGYNSGPAVSQRIWKASGQDAGLTLEELRPLLAPALKRWYGESAEGRAQGLLDVHLPKLRRAYEVGLEEHGR